MNYKGTLTGDKHALTSSTPVTPPTPVKATGGSSSTIDGNKLSGEEHPYHNPSMVSSSRKLNGSDNYLDWSEAVQLNIDGRGKRKWLTGKVTTPPVTDPKYEAWHTENSMIKSWLINSMEPEISRPHMRLPTVYDIWEAMKAMYSDTEDFSQIYELKIKIWSFKQETRDVTTYYNILVALWQELDLCQAETWDCPGDSVKFKKREESEWVYSFLAGLNQTLDEVRGRILGKKPLPSLKEVFAEVRREESRRRVMHKLEVIETESLAMVVDKVDSNRKTSKARPKCDHCKKLGHTKETCWEINGNPWRNKGTRSPTKGSGSQVGGISRVNQASSTSELPTPQGPIPFTQEHLENLNKLFKNMNTNPSCTFVQSGIDVGHQFFSRAEMVVLGFHSHWLNGIDFIGVGKKTNFVVSPLCELPQDCTNFKFPITVAIVVSGQYEDDLDKCEEIIYTGQGGNNLLGDKRQFKDQVMERGNLGLKNCWEQSVPVRVVRGHKCVNSYVGKVYTYDGLYKVATYWAEKGVSGFTVYKFRLRRCEGQPPLTTNQVMFTRTREPVNSNGEILGLVCKDISGGQERIPIPATNLIDDPPIAPTGLTYSKTMVVAEGLKIPSNAPGCKCKGKCTDHRVCACAKLNGSDFPYVQRDGGRLVEAKAVVFECNPNCGCGPECVNKTSQRGVQYRFEVFRTPHKGWGVRSWDYIPSGAPICEYIGILKKTDEVDHATDNCYLFDIDCLQTMKGLDGRERRLRDVSLPMDMEMNNDLLADYAPEYCVDAGSTGNLARFINHSCQPNLFVQCILSSHHDVKLARVVLIAADNIPPLKELTYDYGYALDSVVGLDGKVKQLTCSCGSSDCRKRLF